MQCDILIKNGTVIDGTGEMPYKGDIAVKDGRICAVTGPGDQGGDWEADQVIDAEKLTVCPGFIDIHSHSDFLLPLADHPEILSCLTEQGVTTIVGGNCGFSPAPLAEGSQYSSLVQSAFNTLSGRSVDVMWSSTGSFFDFLERGGLSLNLAQLTGHGTLRASMWGTDYSRPGQDKMRHMCQLIEQSFAEGSFGVSLGLGYEPGMFAHKKELEEIALLAKKNNRLLTVHMRSYSRISPACKSDFLVKPHNIRSIADVLDLAERTGVKIQLSHLFFMGRKSWPSCDRALDMIEAARSRGVDVAFDVFPYNFGNTTINALLSAWFLKNLEKSFKSRLSRGRQSAEWALGWKLLGMGLEDIQLLYGGHPELEKYQGLFFPEIAEMMQCSGEEAILRIAQVSGGSAVCLYYKFSGEENADQVLIKVMKHPLCTFETDVIISPSGIPNPAARGAFPRVIQRYQKEKNIFTLEEAIARMTGKSARRIGLKDRGFLKAGYWADITVFDYSLIKDNTTSQDTGASPSGIEHVFVNGREVVREGRILPGKKHGQVLRCS